LAGGALQPDFNNAAGTPLSEFPWGLTDVVITDIAYLKGLDVSKRADATRRMAIDDDKRVLRAVARPDARLHPARN